MVRILLLCLDLVSGRQAPKGQLRSPQPICAEQVRAELGGDLRDLPGEGSHDQAPHQEGNLGYLFQAAC